jgi:HEPN domain-containing protein
VDSARDAEYRLRLARGFLGEAEEDHLSRWRSCVDNSQLALENAAKAVIALRSTVERLRDLTQELGFEEHIRSDYGEEARGTTPWELFHEPDARRAIELARQALSLAEEIA